MAKPKAVNTYERRDPSKLKNHPLSQKLYADAPDAEFVASIKERGVQQPLLVTADDVVVSGHRRRQGAIMAGLKEVPVVVRKDLTDPLDIEWVLIESNRQREKNNEQKAREAQALFAIEEKRAAARQKATQAKPGEGAVGLTSVPPTNTGEKGKSAEKVAEAIGVGRDTARNLKVAAEAIDEAEAQGDTERAEDIRQTLNTQGAAPAARKAKPPKSGSAVKKFDNKPIEEGLKKVVRTMDAKVKADGGAEYHKACIKRHNDLVAAWEEWKGALRKK